MGRLMVALHLRNDGGSVTFSRNDEGREFLNLIAGQDELLAKEIEDAWWARTPTPFLLPQDSEQVVLAALDSANHSLSPSALRLQKLLQPR